MEITPLKRTDAQLASFCYQSFGAIILKKLSKSEIVNPKIWVNVASRMEMFDEIRVVDENGSFMARLFVTYASGHNIRLKVLEYHVFEVENVHDAHEEFSVRNRGVHKWCVMQADNAEPIFKGIPTKIEAEKAKIDHMAALAR